MWRYEQATGKLLNDAGEVVAIGYSGHAAGKNNPLMQSVSDTGPIPVGTYSIETPFNSPTHGPFAMPLIPSSEATMFGRSGFLMHGDSAAHPGQASLGCVIMPRDIREMVWNSGDHDIEVVSGLPAIDRTTEVSSA